MTLWRSTEFVVDDFVIKNNGFADTTPDQQEIKMTGTGLPRPRHDAAAPVDLNRSR